MKMGGLRSIISGTCRARTVLANVQTPLRIQKYGAHMEGPPQPFDNLPFSVPNRYVNIANVSYIVIIIIASVLLMPWHHASVIFTTDNVFLKCILIISLIGRSSKMSLPNYFHWYICRYAATVFFSVFFGVGLWAPFIIVWYMMAKRTL